MAGIVSYGLHFAAYRLDHQKIAEAWQQKSAKGSKAVACYDEDALTLAAAAAQNLIEGSDPAGYDGLFFASTTSPYLEKSVAAFIAFAHRLPESARTADFAGSRRAATNAIRAALDAVNAGSARRVIVTAGETRTAEPGSALEQIVGDGGAAVCVGDSDTLADIVGVHSVSDENYDEFRRAGEAFVNEGDRRFAAAYNFAPAVARAVGGLLEKTKLAASDITHVALAADNARGLKAAAKKARLDATKLLPAYSNDVGYLGAAQPLVSLVMALEKAKPGDKILWLSYGDGVDALLLEATPRIADLGRSKLEAAVADQRPLATYQKYLKFRGVLPSETPGPGETPVLHHNEHEWNLPLLANECGACGLTYYPPQAVCLKCGASEQQKRVPVPRHGKIFTFTKDHLVQNPDLPQITTVCTAEGGARVFLQGTDFDESKVDIGVPVDFQIRKLHDGADFPVYYWKARPAQG